MLTESTAAMESTLAMESRTALSESEIIGGIESVITLETTALRRILRGLSFSCEDSTNELKTSNMVIASPDFFNAACSVSLLYIDIISPYLTNILQVFANFASLQI
jgi:hypothetical protein